MNGLSINDISAETIKILLFNSFIYFNYTGKLGKIIVPSFKKIILYGFVTFVVVLFMFSLFAVLFFLALYFVINGNKIVILCIVSFLLIFACVCWLFTMVPGYVEFSKTFGYYYEIKLDEKQTFVLLGKTKCMSKIKIIFNSKLSYDKLKYIVFARDFNVTDVKNYFKINVKLTEINNIVIDANTSCDVVFSNNNIFDNNDYVCSISQFCNKETIYNLSQTNLNLHKFVDTSVTLSNAKYEHICNKYCDNNYYLDNNMSFDFIFRNNFKEKLKTLSINVSMSAHLYKYVFARFLWFSRMKRLDDYNENNLGSEESVSYDDYIDGYDLCSRENVVAFLNEDKYYIKPYLLKNQIIRIYHKYFVFNGNYFCDAVNGDNFNETLTFKLFENK